MAKRKIDTIWNGNVRVNTYWDSEWQEYSNVLLVNDKRMDAGTYFTSDKADAISTANDMLVRAYELYKVTGS